MATIREGDSNPKERFVYHAAGADGRGTSSYIDDVILLDADRTNAWTAAAASSLGNRVYYLQNQHHDVSVLMNPNGSIVERVKYSAYGVPYGIVAADLNHNGVVDVAARHAVLDRSGDSSEPAPSYRQHLCTP